MRHMHVAITLAVVVLGSLAAAQETTTTSTNSERQNGVAPPPGPILGGMGTTNYIPIWAGPSFLLDSAIYQTSGNVGIGTTTPAAKLDVNGNINSSLTYQIGGSAVLEIQSAADENLFVGVGAGANNLTGEGRYNTFSCYQAGYNNTGGSGNTFSGDQAGFSNGTVPTTLSSVLGQATTTRAQLTSSWGLRQAH